MENIIFYSEIQDATTTNYTLTSDGWDLLNVGVMIAVFVACISIFLTALFVGIHLSRK